MCSILSTSTPPPLGTVSSLFYLVGDCSRGLDGYCGACLNFIGYDLSETEGCVSCYHILPGFCCEDPVTLPVGKYVFVRIPGEYRFMAVGADAPVYVRDLDRMIIFSGCEPLSTGVIFISDEGFTLDSDDESDLARLELVPKKKCIQ